jgi:hypothetical protein
MAPYQIERKDIQWHCWKRTEAGCARAVPVGSKKYVTTLLSSAHSNRMSEALSKVLSEMRTQQTNWTLRIVDLLHQREEAKTVCPVGDGLLLRLLHGRLVLLNRAMNLLQALDGIFALPEENLRNSKKQKPHTRRCEAPSP